MMSSATWFGLTALSFNIASAGLHGPDAIRGEAGNHSALGDNMDLSGPTSFTRERSPDLSLASGSVLLGATTGVASGGEPNVGYGSEDASVEKSIFGLQTGVLGLWAYNEARLSKSIALRTELGLDFGIWETTFPSTMAWGPRSSRRLLSSLSRDTTST